MTPILLYNAGQKIMAATTASMAAIEFVARFERPQDISGQKPIRSAIADNIFKYVSDKAQELNDFKKMILRLKV